MSKRAISVLVLRPRRQGRHATIDLAPLILVALPTLRKGEIRVIHGEG
jgi:hypothetical protein